MSLSSAMYSSNGITKTLAIYGLPFSLFLFASYYWAIGRLVGVGIQNIIAFGMLLMFFTGEATYVLSPICLGIIAGAFVYNRSGLTEKLEQNPEATSQKHL